MNQVMNYILEAKRGDEWDIVAGYEGTPRGYAAAMSEINRWTSVGRLRRGNEVIYTNDYRQADDLTEWRKRHIA